MIDTPAHAPPAEFVRVPDAVRFARQSYATLLRRHRAGHDVGLRKHGRVVVFHMPTLRAYLASPIGPR